MLYTLVDRLIGWVKQMSLNNIKIKVWEKVEGLRKPTRMVFTVTKKDEEEYDWYVASLVGLGA